MVRGRAAGAVREEAGARPEVGAAVAGGRGDPPGLAVLSPHRLGSATLSVITAVTVVAQAVRPLRRQIPDRNRAGRRGVGESGVPLRPQGPRAGVARGGVRAGRPPGSCLSNVAFRTFERLGGSGVCRRGACSHSVLRERFNRRDSAGRVPRRLGRSDVSLGIAVLGVCPSPRPPAPRVSQLILCRALEEPPDPRPPGRPALSQPALRRASAEIRRGSLRRRSPLCLVLSRRLSLSEGVTDDALCFSLTSESAKPLPGSACRRR